MHVSAIDSGKSSGSASHLVAPSASEELFVIVESDWTRVGGPPFVKVVTS